MGRHPREIELDMEALEDAIAALMQDAEAKMYCSLLWSKVKTIFEQHYIDGWMPDSLEIRKVLAEIEEAKRLEAGASTSCHDARDGLVDMRARHYPQGKMFEEENGGSG